MAVIYHHFPLVKRKISEETWRILTLISQEYRKVCGKLLLKLEINFSAENKKYGPVLKTTDRQYFILDCAVIFLKCVC